MNNVIFGNDQSSYAIYLKNYRNKTRDSFSVIVGPENIMDLQYLVLLLQSIKQRNPKFNFDLLLEPSIKDVSSEAQNARNRDRAQISHYLACFKETLFKNKPILSTGKGAFQNRWLQSSDISFGRIIPLIPVNAKTLDFLSDRVENVFAPSISEGPDKHFIASSDIVLNRAKNKDGKEMTTKKMIINIKGEFPKNSEGIFSDEIGILYNACLNFLFGIDRRSSSDDFFTLLKKRIEKYTTPEFYKKVKNISVLAFLIFCAHNRYSLIEGLDKITNASVRARYNLEVLQHLLPNDKDDDNILLNAMDMADGLLQIIENVIYHAGDIGKENGTGLLSFRIFKNGQDSWSKYLVQKYPYYFDGHDNRLRVVHIEDEDKSRVVSSLAQFNECTVKGLKI